MFTAIIGIAVFALVYGLGCSYLAASERVNGKRLSHETRRHADGGSFIGSNRYGED